MRLVYSLPHACPVPFPLDAPYACAHPRRKPSPVAPAAAAPQSPAQRLDALLRDAYDDALYAALSPAATAAAPALAAELLVANGKETQDETDDEDIKQVSERHRAPNPSRRVVVRACMGKLAKPWPFFS